jgi:sodium-dependent dicarboxylate transporter 2/3/5
MEGSLKKISIAVVIGVALFFASETIFTLQQASLIGLIGFLITLWTNEGLHLGVVSLLPLVLFPTAGVLDFNSVAPNYSKTIVYLFIGGFLIAMAMQKSGLHEKIAVSILSIFPSSVRGIMYALAITSGVMSGVLSNTTVTILLVPIAMFLSEEREIQFRLILSVAYGATVGGILTPIGTAPNLIYLGFAEDHGLPVMGFFEWITALLPVVGVMMLIIPYILSLGIENKRIETADVDKSLNGEQKRVLYLLIGLVTVLLLNSKMEPLYSGLGLNEKLLLLGAGLSLFLPNFGVLTWKDMEKFPFAIIFLFGASFTIATAFTSTGLAEAITGYMNGLQVLPLLLLMAVVVSLVCFTTEVTSNTALISMALPVLYTFIQQNGVENGEVILFMATVVSSYAFMLPIATPPNAIAVSTGKVSIGRMAKIGFLLNIIGIAVLVTVGYTIWI